jgi:ABC-type multidrug transport system ATPase subunit
MEEAERLCDRVALIDTGKVVAIDTPAGLAGRVEAGQRIQLARHQIVAHQLRVNQASLEDAFLALASASPA